VTRRCRAHRQPRNDSGTTAIAGRPLTGGGPARTAGRPDTSAGRPAKASRNPRSAEPDAKRSRIGDGTTPTKTSASVKKTTRPSRMHSTGRHKTVTAPPAQKTAEPHHARSVGHERAKSQCRMPAHDSEHNLLLPCRNRRAGHAAPGHIAGTHASRRRYGVKPTGRHTPPYAVDPPVLIGDPERDAQP